MEGVGVKCIFIEHGRIVFERNLRAVPPVGSVVNKGVRPVDYVVERMVYNIGGNGVEEHVEIFVKSSKA